MRILITGGTGAIGGFLIQALVDDGHEIIALSRNPAGAPDIPDGVRVVGWDAQSAKGWGELAEGAGAIINMAGARIGGVNPFKLRWSEARKRVICDSRRLAGQAVSEAVTQTQVKPGYLIQLSAIDYYAADDRQVNEDSPQGKDFMSHVTGDCWEPTTQAVEDQGVARAILRMGPVMFKGSPILEPLLLQHRLFAGGPIGSGEQGMSWVHIDDVIGVMRWLLADRTRQGAFNLCAPNPVTNRQASKIIGRVLGRPSYLPTPAFLFRLLFGEMADTILQGPLAYPERLQADGYAFQFPELEGALREILNKA